MSFAQDLRASILQAAIQGKLTRQLPTDSSVDDLLASIAAEKEALIKQKKIKKEKPLAPISEDEIPFDIPDNWRWIKLEEISALITKGTTPRGGNISYLSSGIGFIRAENVAGLDKINRDNLKYIDNETHNGFLKRSIIQENDILITIAGTLGRTALVRKEDLPLNTNQAVSIVRLVNPESINLMYLIYAINAPLITMSLINQKKVTAIPNLTLEIISDYMIPLPPIEEQQRIVDKVEELMVKIDELEKTEYALKSIKSAFPDDMKAAILQAAMQGKLTEQLPTDSSVDELLVSIAAEKVELIKQKKIKKGKTPKVITEDDFLFDIPDSWSWVRFGDLVSYNIGKTPARAEKKYWGDDTPWVSISDMPENGVVVQTKEKVSATAMIESFKGNVSPSGTLIMSFKLTVGRVSILGIDAVHNEAIISIFPLGKHADIVKSWLFKILPFVTQYGDSKNAIKGKTLNDTSISNLMIPVPPIEEQQRIVEKLDKLLPLCDKI